MRTSIIWILAMMLVLGLWACGDEVVEEEQREEQPSVTVTVEGSGNLMPNEGNTVDVPTQSGTQTSSAPRGAAVPQGGILAVSNGQAVFLSQQGGIALADLETAGGRYLSGAPAAELYFDSKQIYYTDDEGIYAISPEGESRKLSDCLSYAMWVEGSKIYYIRQTDLTSEQPYGELWCMENDGSSAVLILAAAVKGDFCIKDGWIYYVSADDGALYRSMLFGSQVTKLADGPVELCFVTEHGVFYKELNGRQGLRRIDLKSGANISLGAYGEIVISGETIAIMARRESASGSLDNHFVLLSFDDHTQELAEHLVFENVGGDSLAWMQGDYVYLYGELGGIYRMHLNDETQTKELLFEGDAVFADGYAWNIGDSELNVYDCASLEMTAIQIG